MVDVAGDAVEGTVDAAGNVVEAAGDVVEGTVDVAGDVVEGAANVVSGAADAVSDGADAVADAVSDDDDSAEGDEMEDKEEMMDDDKDAMDGDDKEEMMDDDHSGDDADEMEDKEEMMDDASAGTFAPYTAEAAVATDDNKVVLAFLADWCPSCRSFEADITAEAANIPAGLTVLRVDYDLETELKEKYGVTGQHTFVQIDADGELVMKKRGAQTLADLVNIVQ